MAEDNQEVVSINHNQYENAPATNMTYEERDVKVAEAEKVEQERQNKWAIRADVVYHFFAYRYFDRSAMCLDFLNFSDADIDSFNLTANKTRGLNNWHICAEYLKTVPDATPETNTHRRRLIHKVRTFNKTQAPHFRFYLQNLTEDDIAYIQILCEQEKDAIIDPGVKEKKLIWATSCVEDEAPVGVQGHVDSDTVDLVKVAIERCLNDHREMLREKTNQSIALKAHKNSQKVEVIRDELTEQFKQLAISGGDKEAANGVENFATN